ncbi:MAG: disulfide bond formation protein B [Alphaproteobacteria bacterium]|nr:disulfide bond formation protein B [Alphaproteobacteria bacterium]
MIQRLKTLLIPTTARYALMLLLAASVLTLGSALVSQYGFGLHPCTLCMWQRWPYAGVIAMALLSLLVSHNGGQRALLSLCSLSLAVGTGIAVYHTGVEYGIFEGLQGCSGDLQENATIEEMRRAIMEASSVRCDEPALVVLGISMAGWNALVSGALTLYGSYSLLLLRKRA